MPRFFSFPGTPPRGGEGGMGRKGGYERPPQENPLYEEFYAARKETSHTQIGLSGSEVHLEGTPAVVLHEERQHDGTIEQYVRKSAPTGDSGTMQLKWKPDEKRTMKLVESKRTFD